MHIVAIGHARGNTIKIISVKGILLCFNTYAS